MKIRIKGDSIRLRLTKKEVDTLVQFGKVSENTQFSFNKSFTYSIVSSPIDDIKAVINEQSITIHISKNKLIDWDINDIIGFNHTVENGNKDGLYLLIEKDFKCLTPRERENEEDHYENPLNEHTC